MALKLQTSLKKKKKKIDAEFVIIYKKIIYLHNSIVFLKTMNILPVTVYSIGVQEVMYSHKMQNILFCTLNYSVSP